jgi:hypothetical protein
MVQNQPLTQYAGLAQRLHQKKAIKFGGTFASTHRRLKVIARAGALFAIRPRHPAAEKCGNVPVTNWTLVRPDNSSTAAGWPAGHNGVFGAGFSERRDFST